MNLAQLIPPEWAQEGCRPRHELARQAEELVQAVAAPAAIRLGQTAYSICAVMAQSPEEWWACKSVADFAGLPANRTSVMLGELLGRGVLERRRVGNAGRRGNRVEWRITMLGLASVKARG